MKDLYRAIQVQPTAGEAEIRAALANPAIARAKGAESARAVLLSPNRRDQYDRVYRAVSHIARLRAKTDLQGTKFEVAHEADFRPLPKSGHVQGGWHQPPSSGTAREKPNGGSYLSSGCMLVLLFSAGVLIHLYFEVNKMRPATVPTGSAVTAEYSAAGAGLVPMELPFTGAFDFSGSSSQNAIIVKTRQGSDHTLVKIENIGGQEITRGFIRAGQQHTFHLPMGVYVLKTASGSTWYGPENLFGPTTRYSRPDDTFPLNQVGDQWTVELIPQRGGNLRDRAISAADF